MKLKKVFPYNIKRALPVLGLAGASLFMAGCNKDDEPTVPTEPITPTVDVVLTFSSIRYEDILYIDENGERYPSELIKSYVKDPNVRAVYLVPSSSWSHYNAEAISKMRSVTLEPVLLAYSPKIKGKGDFSFKWGEASKVPEDSLWYVSKGWTINKYRDGPNSNSVYPETYLSNKSKQR